IEAQGLGPAVERDELLEDADDAGCRDRCPHFDGQRFPVGLIEHVERSEAPPAVERVVHEVERPDAVEYRGRREGWRQPMRDTTLRAPRQIEPQRAVDPMHPFVVPGMPVEPEPVETLPEAP